MTTIAYRDGVMAADTLVCGGGARRGRTVKIRKVGPYLIGASGTCSLCQAFLDWGSRGFRGDPPSLRASDEDTASAMLVTPERIILFWDTGHDHLKADYFALGSGSDYALGAMAFGAGAVEAVGVAIQLDPGSGGEITVLRR